MKLKLGYIVLVLMFMSLGADAQKMIVYGYIKDSITRFAVAGATINNVTGKKKVTSDANGLFVIEASPNDFFYILKTSYRPETFTYTFLSNDTATIVLAPTGNVLPGVTVRTGYTRYQLDSIKRRTDFEENRGGTLNTVSSSHGPGFGLTVNLDRFFKKKYKNQKSDERAFSNLEMMAYVDYRYSPYVVQHYTSFKGDTLKDFMNRFTPDYNWLRQHPTNEDVMYYINDKLKAYRELNKK